MEEEKVEQTVTSAGGSVLQVAGNYEHVDEKILSFGEDIFFELESEGAVATFPTLPESFTTHLQRDSLLILGGHNDIDMTALAYDVANHARTTLFDDADAPCREWNRNFTADRTLQDIRTGSKPGVFVFTGAGARDFAAVLPDLRIALRASSSVAVLATDDDRSQWNLTDAEKNLWPQWAKNDVFPAPARAALLSERLAVLPLTADLRDRLMASADTLSQHLETPQSIERFVGMLSLEAPETLTDERITELLNEAASMTDIAQNFYRRLDGLSREGVPRERLLILVIALLCGMPTEEVLASADIIVTRAWRQRVPGLMAFDYEDLNAIRAIFSIPTGHGRGELVRALEEESRATILRLAAHRHGRFLQTALRIIAQLAEDSVDHTKQTQFEIFSSSRKRARFRAAVSDTLKVLQDAAPEQCIGFIWRLASHPNPGVQAVAARGLAFSQRTDGLLEKFADLRRGSDELAKVAMAFGAETRSLHRASRNITSTLALALGHAIHQEPVGALDARLVKEVKTLMEMGASVPPVLKHFLLPFLIARHFHQLNEDGVLLLWAQDRRWYVAVANGLHQASRNSAKAVPALLAEWIKHAMDMPSVATGEEPGKRECMLSCVARTYGAVDFTAGPTPFDRDAVFENLTRIAENEPHSVPRSAVMAAITDHARAEPDKIKTFLRTVLASLGDAERDLVARSLVQIFLEQRRELIGGDYAMVLDDEAYDLWRDGMPPKTPIEAAMLSWLDDTDDATLAAFAFRVFLIIAADFDMPAFQFLAEARKAELEDENAAIITPETVEAATKATRNWLLDTAIPFVATLKNSALRGSVSAILSRHIDLWDTRKPLIGIVLERLRRSGRANASQIAASLDVAAKLYANRVGIAIGLFIALGLFYLIL